uniref:CYP16-1 n=1 Tax=Gentiana crassa subsp. rigescens TaxID=3097545 RepID=A0A2Z0N6W6_9GENT|nr:CYP16-1 [Gentiana rigescens]AKJ26129.1 CYP16-2 [Gentiana rigescens]
MDLLLLCMLIILPILSYIALKFLFHNSKTSKHNNANLPPGSTGWPLIGETMKLGMFGRLGIPESFYKERMKKYSPQVFKTSLIGEKTVVFCGAAGNKFLYSNENKLVSMFFPVNLSKVLPHLGEVNNVSEVTYKARNLLVNFLKHEYLQDCVKIVDELARKHLDSKWDSQKEVKALPLAKEFAFEVACKLFLSIDDPSIIQGIAKPFHVLTAGIYSIPVNLPGTAFNKAIKAASLIREKLLRIIKERKEHLMAEKSPWSHDLLWDLILVADDDGKLLSELEIADDTLAFLLASQDAISTTITLIVKSLAEFHQVYQEVLKEQNSIVQEKESSELNWKDVQKMKYLWNVASEVMRLMPPSQGGFREALVDFSYSGFFIPKGWKLYWTPHTTHKDPQYFPEPEKFDPSRYDGAGPVPYSYVTFGGGPRMCPAKDFARIIILVFVHNLVRRFHWEKLLPNEKILVQPVPIMASGLPVRLHPHI